MKHYETTIVIDSLQKPEDIQQTITKLQTFIKNNGGEIANVEEWGKKRLAYEINRRQYGTYFQIHFTGPGTLPKLLEREYLLDESILRYLTLALEPKVFQAKLAAKAEKEAPKAEPKAKEPAPEPTPEATGEANAEEPAPTAAAAEDASETD